MRSPAYGKAKGRAGENGVVDALKARFPDLAQFIERKAKAGAKDKGDIAGIPGVTIEVKNVAKMALADWVKQANAEASNAGNLVGVVWHKKKGTTNALDWYVTMDGRTFVEFLEAYQTPRSPHP